MKPLHFRKVDFSKVTHELFVASQWSLFVDFSLAMTYRKHLTFSPGVGRRERPILVNVTDDASLPLRMPENHHLIIETFNWKIRFFESFSFNLWNSFERTLNVTSMDESPYSMPIMLVTPFSVQWKSLFHPKNRFHCY